LNFGLTVFLIETRRPPGNYCCNLPYCLFVPRIHGRCSSVTSRSWWITHSTQRRVCNTAYLTNACKHLNKQNKR